MSLSNSQIQIANFTLSQQIYDVLRDRIIKGDIEPGSRLVIGTIANELGVSSTPVRDALHNLVTNGFAVKDVQAGICVISLSRRDFEEIYDLREVLEGLCARLVIDQIDAVEIDHIYDQFDNTRKELVAGSVNDAHALDVRFHDSLLAFCPSERLRRQITVLMNQTYRIRTIQYHSRIKDFQSGIRASRVLRELDEHIEIVDAISKRDGMRAERCMRSHINSAKLDVLNHVDIPEWNIGDEVK